MFWKRAGKVSEIVALTLREPVIVVEHYYILTPRKDQGGFFPWTSVYVFFRSLT